MSPTIEVSAQTMRDLQSHRREDESYDDLVQELLSVYEQEGTFVREGYSE